MALGWHTTAGGHCKVIMGIGGMWLDHYEYLGDICLGDIA